MILMNMPEMCEKIIKEIDNDKFEAWEVYEVYGKLKKAGQEPSEEVIKKMLEDSWNEIENMTEEEINTAWEEHRLDTSVKFERFNFAVILKKENPDGGWDSYLSEKQFKREYKNWWAKDKVLARWRLEKKKVEQEVIGEYEKTPEHFKNYFGDQG